MHHIDIQRAILFFLFKSEIQTNQSFAYVSVPFDTTLGNHTKQIKLPEKMKD